MVLIGNTIGMQPKDRVTLPILRFFQYAVFGQVVQNLQRSLPRHSGVDVSQKLFVIEEVLRTVNEYLFHIDPFCGGQGISRFGQFLADLL